MSPYLLKSLTPVRYLVSLLHSLPFLRSSPASQAGMRYFYIPSEMSCAHKICFDTNTSVSLCCFFHTVTPLHSHNMDTLLLPWPFLSPSTVLFILPPPLPFFNSIVTSPIGNSFQSIRFFSRASLSCAVALRKFSPEKRMGAHISSRRS